MSITAIIGAIVSVVGAIISVTFGLISVRAQAQKEVEVLYDQMVKFRTEHPEVLSLSRRWTHGLWHRVYVQTEPADREWVIYYSFVELCLGYCSAVLFSKSRLGKASYEYHHKPLVKLLLTEHNPIIEDLLREGKYISPHVKRFREELQSQGWNWQKEHTKLAS